MKELGRHVIVEFYDCDPEILNDLLKIEEAMVQSALVSGATIVGRVFHPFVPHGVSGAVVIAESHFSIHTWPEYNYAAVDLFTCGNSVDPWKAFQYLGVALKSGRTSQIELRRGLFPTEMGAVHKPGPNT